jgi:hypothetical protein
MVLIASDLVINSGCVCIVVDKVLVTELLSDWARIVVFVSWTLEKEWFEDIMIHRELDNAASVLLLNLKLIGFILDEGLW